ncbi:nucleotidyltransferase family protein [Bacteroidota bacterium]
MRKNYNRFSEENNFILDFIHPEPVRSINYSISQLNWDYIIHFSERHGISGLILKNILKSRFFNAFTEDNIKPLENIYCQTIAANSNKIFVCEKLVKFANTKNLPVIPLKGIFLAPHIYKDIGLRPMSDIDILVKKQHLEFFEKYLFNSGFEKTTHIKSKYIDEFNFLHHLPAYVKKDIIIEIHYRLGSTPIDFNNSLNNIWDRSQLLRKDNLKFYSFTAEDLLIYQCYHTYKHFKSGKLRLCHFCDIPKILNHYTNTINWSVLHHLSDSYNLLPALKNIFGICNTYFGTRLPDEYYYLFRPDLKKNTERKFIRFMAEKKISSQSIFSFLSRVKSIKATRYKIYYMLFTIFPSPEFIQFKYNLNKKWKTVFYYPLRIIKALLNIII